jgi:hypothetical protein
MPTNKSTDKSTELRINKTTDNSTKPEIRNGRNDTTIEMIQRAIETNAEITLVPRRMHTLRGIPVDFDYPVLRLYLDTGKEIVSILLGDVGCFIFPRELWNLKIKSDAEKNSESPTEYMKRDKENKR